MGVSNNKLGHVCMREFSVAFLFEVISFLQKMGTSCLYTEIFCAAAFPHRSKSFPHINDNLMFDATIFYEKFSAKIHDLQDFEVRGGGLGQVQFSIETVGSPSFLHYCTKKSGGSMGEESIPKDVLGERTVGSTCHEVHGRWFQWIFAPSASESAFHKNCGKCLYLRK